MRSVHSRAIEFKTYYVDGGKFHIYRNQSICYWYPCFRRTNGVRAHPFTFKHVFWEFLFHYEYFTPPTSISIFVILFLLPKLISNILHDEEMVAAQCARDFYFSIKYDRGEK